MPSIKLPVLRYPNPRLREVSRDVDDAVDRNVKQLVDAMIETMYENKGAGLSAVQVGAPLRVFVLDGDLVTKGMHALVFVNPVLDTTVPSKKEVTEEGCLSFPGVAVEVERFTEVALTAFNRDGKMFTIGLSGYAAKAAQHELDHLEGRLLIDHLSSIKRDILNRKIAKSRRLQKARRGLRVRPN